MEIALHDGKDEVLLRAKDMNWELCWKRRVKQEDGSYIDEWWPKKWFGNLVSALERVGELQLMKSEASSLGELQNEVKRLRRELVECYELNLPREISK